MIRVNGGLTRKTSKRKGEFIFYFKISNIFKALFEAIHVVL